MCKLLLVTMSLIFLAGCASINSISLTPIPAERKAQVKTEKSKVIFMGFNFENDFVNSIVDDLKRQCPNGKVTGILTKDEDINYFLYIVWKKQITATGFCVPNTMASSTKNKSRGTASEATEDSLESEL